MIRCLRQSDFVESDRLTLYYPRQEWFAENAAAMLRIAGDAAERLEAKFGLRLPCAATVMVTDPESAIAIQGVTGAAYHRLTVIGVPERQLSRFGRTVGHELAHLCARALTNRATSFEAEGFACYAAARIGADHRPTGLPVHHHLAFLLSRGVRPRLAELWERRDYSCELYDLAWSFAHFAASEWGKQPYLDFYAAEGTLERQVEAAFGVSVRVAERQWHDHVASRITVNLRGLTQMRRAAGYVCGQASWLRAHAPQRAESRWDPARFADFLRKRAVSRGP